MHLFDVRLSLSTVGLTHVGAEGIIFSYASFHCAQLECVFVVLPHPFDARLPMYTLGLHIRVQRFRVSCPQACNAQARVPLHAGSSES